jgi:hypothetical protein
VRGGKRKGAGRKQGSGQYAARLVVRVSEDDRDWLRGRARTNETTETEEVRRLIADARKGEWC